jgi:hypothetical protein
MSIAAILQRHLDSGALVKLPSLVTGNETPREIIVTREIYQLLSQNLSDDLEGERLVEFRETLDAFSEHGQFSVAENPDNKPPYTMLARVHDVRDELWSMRITEPDDTPGIRALGAFSDTNKFVVLAWEYRELMNFDADVAAVKQQWKMMFGNQTPHSGDNLDAYLTNYIAL